MKISRILFAAMVLLSLISCGNSSNNSSKNEENNLRIICEELKPYSFSESGEQKGIALDIVQNILDSRNLKNKIEITTDWEGAINELNNNNNVVLFTTAITEERKSLYQWAGSIALFTAGFISLEDFEIVLPSYNDAKNLDSVGVISGYATSEMLENEGFQNLKYYDTINDAVQELYEERVDVIFEVHSLLQVAAQDLGYDPSVLKNLLTFLTNQGYIAFSKDIPAGVVENWQEEIDKMKDEGVVQQIHEEYLPGSVSPGKLLIFTEDNPPQNMKDPDGNLSGSSVEIVEALMNEIGISENIDLTNWTNAYHQIQVAPNTMTFSTLRTEVREDLFHWVGPVCRKSYAFYVRTDGDIKISTIDEAKQLESVGTMTGWSSENQLIDLGFTNVVTWATPTEVFQQLVDGEIDAAVLNDISIILLAEDIAVSDDIVTMAFVLSTGETYLAFSLDTKAEYIDSWVEAYQRIVDNGTFQQIWDKWYPHIDS
jgi:polar amino acid transport system substrate-binding protein